MSIVNIGIIGAGMIGDVHIDRIRQDGRGEVTWIASRTEKTLQDKRQKFSIQNGSTDYRDMLRDDSLDAVVIAAPPFTHVQMMKDCLAAGKHILLEKPMVVNPQELEELLKVVKDYPHLKILECSCRHTRLQPKFQYIKKMIDDGAIGEVYHIHHQSVSRGTFIDYNPNAAWAHQKTLAGGGPFFDWGVYDLSFHLGLLNDVPQLTDVKSFTRNGFKVFKDDDFISDIEEHGAAYLEFDTGLTYYYERGSGVQAEAPNETRIYGTKGSLCFAFCSWEPADMDYYCVEKNGDEKHEVITIDIPEEHNDNMELTHHFLDVLIEKTEPRMTVEMAAKHLKILFKILKSY